MARVHIFVKLRSQVQEYPTPTFQAQRIEITLNLVKLRVKVEDQLLIRGKLKDIKSQIQACDWSN